MELTLAQTVAPWLAIAAIVAGGFGLAIERLSKVIWPQLNGKDPAQHLVEMRRDIERLKNANDELVDAVERLQGNEPPPKPMRTVNPAPSDPFMREAS